MILKFSTCVDGVLVYVYLGRLFHVKLTVMDGKVLLAGTANFTIILGEMLVVRRKTDIPTVADNNISAAYFFIALLLKRFAEDTHSINN